MEKTQWQERLDFYDSLMTSNPNLERKGKTMAYTSANGYMFSLVNKAGEIGIRLSKETQKRFAAEHGTGPYMSHGAVMRDYVHVPEALHGSPEVLEQLLAESYDFVMSLPPKATKKPKKAKKAKK